MTTLILLMALFSVNCLLELNVVPVISSDPPLIVTPGELFWPKCNESLTETVPALIVTPPVKPEVPAVLRSLRQRRVARAIFDDARLRRRAVGNVQHTDGQIGSAATDVENSIDGRCGTAQFQIARVPVVPPAVSSAMNEAAVPVVVTLPLRTSAEPSCPQAPRRKLMRLLFSDSPAAPSPRTTASRSTAAALHNRQSPSVPAGCR